MRYIKKDQPVVHVIVGFELGPRNGSFFFVPLVAFFFVPTILFFNRASAAAARSNRIFSRSALVK